MSYLSTDEKIDVVVDAMKLLAQVEDMLQGLDDPHVEAYVIGRINASGTYANQGLYQELEDTLDELKDEEKAERAEKLQEEGDY